MANKVKDLVKIGKKIKQFREGNAFSLVNFAIVTGVSAATLSRIENAGQYSQEMLDPICAIMGINAEDLLTTDVRKIPKEQIADRIADQVEKRGIRKTEFNQINRKRKSFHGPSYLVRQAMEDGFLSQFRHVNEIQTYIRDEYGITLISSSITNALNRKEDIVYRPSGISNYKQYKFVRRKSKI